MKAVLVAEEAVEIRVLCCGASRRWPMRRCEGKSSIPPERLLNARLLMARTRLCANPQVSVFD